MSKPHQAAPAPAKVVTLFRGDHLEPILRIILADFDGWYRATRTHRGTEPRLDKIVDTVHDLLCEVVA